MELKVRSIRAIDKQKLAFDPPKKFPLDLRLLLRRNSACCSDFDWRDMFLVQNE